MIPSLLMLVDRLTLRSVERQRTSASEIGRGRLIEDPTLIQVCMGILYGAPNDSSTLMALVRQLPVYLVFSIEGMQHPYVALASSMGANVRVGLEDELYLYKGRLATDAQLVKRVVQVLERGGVRIIRPGEVREQLALKLHA